MNIAAYEKLNARRKSDFERFRIDGVEFNSYKIEQSNAYSKFAEKLAGTIVEEFGDDRRSELVENYHDGIYWMIKHESDLYEELKTIASDVECLKDCAIVFMPNMQMLSFSSHIDGDVYGIEIYYGLFLQANLLVQAVLLEDDCPDEQGKNLYRWIVDTFFSPQEMHYLARLHISQQVNIKTSTVADLIVRFFALHELGHIALKHTGAGEQKLNEELEADLFAMRYLLKNTQSYENIWQAYAFVSLFFELLDDVDAVRKISHGHPSGFERRQKLYEFLVSQIDKPQNDILLWFGIIINKWREKMAPNIEFKIYTQNPNEILELFEGDDYLQTAEGFGFRIVDTKQKQGGIIDETIISFVIDVVHGVPHDLLVAYIYEKFVNRGKNIAEIGEKFTREVNELKKMIEDLSKKGDEK